MAINMSEFTQMPDTVLAFWFNEAGSSNWFAKNDGFDAEIRRRFEQMAVKNAAIISGGAHPWETDSKSALALILTLDQFPRNMYRGTPAAFAWDPLALKAAENALNNGFDLKSSQTRRAFFYMPFMHSEKLADQDRCVALNDQRLDDSATLHHAKAHRRLIERFGRFPHRNAILGRASSVEEKQFLKNDGYAP